MTGLFRGVHVLPPFPSSGDRGFAPITYEDIDPAFGSWADVGRIAADHDVLLDLMINHISRQSPEFRDFERRGARSPNGRPVHHARQDLAGRRTPAEDVARIFLRKPDAPFSTVTIERTGPAGTDLDVFGTADWSEQIDLDVQSPVTRALVTRGSGSSLCMASGSSGSMQSVTSSRSRGRPASWSNRRSGTSSSGSPGSPDRSASWSCPRSTTCTRPTTAVGPRLLDVRLRPAGPAPAHV